MENEMKCETELLNFQSLREMVENNYSGFSSGNDSFYKMLDDGIRLLATMRIEDSLANDIKLFIDRLYKLRDAVGKVKL